MDKFDRIQKLHRIFRSHRYPVPRRILAEKLECSERQVRRLIESMQMVDAPVEYDPARRGWHYVDKLDNLFELPGLWLTGDELQHLSLLLSVLHTIGSGLLDEEISVIEGEIGKLLKARGINPSTLVERIRVLPISHRLLPSRIFHEVCDALEKKRQLEVEYVDYSGSRTHRSISPQTLVHYRDNWYLDAWCHFRNDLRTFSIARLESVEISKQNSIDVDAATLLEHFATSYGIFSDKPKHVAQLRFFADVAREVAMQQWHPDQEGKWDGSDYILKLPYSDDRELVQDILRHVPQVYVEAPVSLRKAVQHRLHTGLEIFSGKRITRT